MSGKSKETKEKRDSFVLIERLRTNCHATKIANKHKHLKQLNNYSINIVINTCKNKIETTHEKKFNNLHVNKQKEKGVKENPNNTIWNLITRVLSNEEYQVLRYGLNHGLATYQKQNDILASVECVWDQINKKNICEET